MGVNVFPAAEEAAYEGQADEEPPYA